MKKTTTLNLILCLILCFSTKTFSANSLKNYSKSLSKEQRLSGKRTLKKKPIRLFNKSKSHSAKNKKFKSIPKSLKKDFKDYQMGFGRILLFVLMNVLTLSLLFAFSNIFGVFGGYFYLMGLIGIGYLYFRVIRHI